MRHAPAPVRAVAPRKDWKAGNSDRIIAIGVSTGGVEALKKALMGLPKLCPPVVITQHMRDGDPKSSATAHARAV